MEKGQAGSSSSSSFTAQLFGPKESTSSANFNSIFPPPSKSFQGTARNILSSKHGSLEKRKDSSTCNLSSSIYYGGQEVYSQSTQNFTYPPINKDQDRDKNDANSSDASRGDWWQGSLYY
ncbi:PREDICTED: uncharacterized protein LOC104780496 isoform X1 [Camelina sativa]|uniref:Uncharacterized protein LOC104780496 isoform X1 n=1 Tax=Camelina sativa TaxID=90675 RepID=A0ABM0YMN0_CAMSA|nr:PREDICTED: uncharacterized protein LOC104780496 isoform X1 [Camelina sativa]